MGLTPKVIDVPIVALDESRAEHQGPLGRVTALKNAQVTHYVPPSPGVQQQSRIEQREGFVSLPTALRSVADGTVASGSWSSPELLAPLGDQLVSICGAVPRVLSGTAWSQYADARVLTNQLSQDIIHTSNRTIQATDSAVMNGVTCSVWTETVGVGTTAVTISYVGFRGSDGSWSRLPTILANPNSSSVPVMARVVTDGSLFWVFYNVSGFINVHTYDVHGALSATHDAAITNIGNPGYWDVTSHPTVKLAQPVAVGTDSGVVVTLLSQSIGVITATSHTDATMHCGGSLAWITDDLNAFSYLATVSPGTTPPVWAYEVPSNVQTHEYSFGDATAQPDSLTGWVVQGGGGVDCYVAFSILSNFSPSSGPPFDPGLRFTQTKFCTRAGSASTVKISPQVIQVSRAFKVDSDYYAATYYQSGGGRTRDPTTTPVSLTAGDSMYGAPVQSITVQSGDSIQGAAVSIDGGDSLMQNTQAIGTITHNVGDSVAADVPNNKATWTLLNASFNAGLPSDPAVGSLLTITGSSISHNNTSYYVTKRVSATVVETVLNGTNGFPATSEPLTGVTASLVAQATAYFPSMVPSPFGVAQLNGFIGGTMVIAGSATGANDGTYLVNLIITNYTDPGFGIPTMVVFVTRLVPPTPAVIHIHGSMTATLIPANENRWNFLFSPGQFSTVLDIPIGGVPTMMLNVQDFSNPNNTGSFPITSVASVFSPVTANQPQLQYEVFAPPTAVVPLPVVTKSLVNPDLAYTFNFQGASFGPNVLGAVLTVGGTSVRPENRGAYKITQVIDSTHLRVVPTSGTTNQRNQVFAVGMGADTEISIIVSAEPSPGVQPCWFLTPLALAQMTAGRWEYGIAYADWRFDGDTVPNTYHLHVTSIATTTTGLQLALPYRAESFTAGKINAIGNVFLNEVAVQVSTVGIKLFQLANAHGLAAPLGGKLLLPGPMAGSFVGQAFREDAINLAPETPFFISQTTNAGIPIGLTVGATYQYVIVAEATDENGDRIFSRPSGTLEVVMNTTNNTATIGGRLIRPTNWPVDASTFKPSYSLAIYRTAIVDGIPTIQHYKITNDLDINGAGFSFPDGNTWHFVDNIPDVEITSAEQLYTDRGFIQRFPAPAESQAVASWKNRTWAIGYDGAVWMSGEKTEGDAIWFHPAFRYLLPTDDKPVALAPLDDFLLVLCHRSVWYIPAATFPGANGQGGILPTPVQLTTVNNGCTGFAIPVQGGVAYSSTAGGVWLITRQLTNSWLSEDVRDSLMTVTGMTVDGNQRLFVATGTTSVWVYDQVTSMWWQWVAPTAAQLIATSGARAVYQDSAQVVKHTPAVFADSIGGVITGSPPDITFASLSFAQVRAFSRMWALQVVGVYKGPHRLNAVLSYTDEDEPDTTYAPFVPTANEPYVFEINPRVEEASAYGLRLFADFVGVATPGDSFTLELISCEVGIEAGLGRLPPAQRIGR